MRKWLKILIVLAVILLILGIIAWIWFYFSSGRHEEQKALKKEKLVRYRYSRGGDMRGSRYSEEIRLQEDGSVIRSIASADWYGADDAVTEYRIDAEVLRELEAVFRRYHMNRWAHRRISRIFVADGASYGYDFTFGDTGIDFSSQVYMGRYRKGINELAAVIEKYGETQEKLPGLVLPEETGNEYEEKDRPKPGVLSFEVCKYCGGYLYCRLLNGTEEPQTVINQFRLVNTATGEEIPVTNSKYSTEYTVGADRSHEERIQVNTQLPAGTYRLEAGSFAADFEIR